MHSKVKDKLMSLESDLIINTNSVSGRLEITDPDQHLSCLSIQPISAGLKTDRVLADEASVGTEFQNQTADRKCACRYVSVLEWWTCY